MARFTTEARVGLFVLLGIALMVYMSMSLGKFQLGHPEGYEIYALFDTASGLKLNVPVEIAGVEVGRVMAVQLEGGRARVRLNIHPEVELRKDAGASIRTKGLLGDRYIEIYPGLPSQPRLAPGGRIERTTVPPDVDKLLVRLGEIGEDIQLLTGTLSQVLGGEEAGETIKDVLRNVHDLSENLNRTMNQNMAHFDKIMANFDYFSGDLRDITEANKEAITETVASMRKTSEQLQLAIGAIGELAEKINQGEGTLGRLINDPEIAENLNATLAALREISDRIDRGEGSLGKLVRDEETVENLNETLTGLNRTLGLQERFKVYLGYRGEYLTKDSDLKSYVSLRIQPRPDKYYSLALVDAPKNDGDNDIKFSAQIAKRYYDLLLRGGLIESTGGFGLEYYFYDDSLKFAFEAFDFRGEPHLKFYSDYTFLKHLFITAGIDSDEGRENLFIGGGIKFLDEDLKALIGGGGASAAAAAAH